MGHSVDNCICGSGVQDNEETEPEYRCDHNMNRDHKWKLHGWCCPHRDHSEKRKDLRKQ